MLVKSLLPIAVLFGTVLADGSAIVSALTGISTAITTLNTTVAAWTGNPLTVFQIVAESTKLLLVIHDAILVADASANLTNLDVLGVASATQSLATTVEGTLATIVEKKHLFELELLQPAILLNLIAEKKATDKFSAAVVAKVPAALQATAGQLTAPIDAAFDSAISEYEKL